MVNDEFCELSHEPRAAARGGSRSPCVRRTTGIDVTWGPTRSAPSHQPGGTICFRRVLPRRLRERPPRSMRLARSLARTELGPLDERSRADLATTCDRASRGSAAGACCCPSRNTSISEVLRRPLESAQYLAIRYTERLAEVGGI